jgi:pilus assembly protein CpaB
MIGAVVRKRIATGEPITDGAVVKPGERGFLAAVLEPGMRAVSVPLTPTSSNSGLIFPGDRVDLILTQSLVESKSEGSVRRVSETVLSDIRIIAMGAETGDDPQEGDANEKAKTATLEVTPAQAEKVALLTELGKLSLSLRSLAAPSPRSRRCRKTHPI